MLAATSSVVAEPPRTTIMFPSAAAADTGKAAYDQDRACINPDTRTIGVFDGHGDYGALAAQTAADIVASSSAVTPFADLFAAAETAVRDAMRAQITAEGKPLHEYEGALYRQAPPPQRHFAIPMIQYRGGTTASVLRIAEDGALSFANVGDSDVVVFDGPADPGRTLIADHTPTSLAEWERVHAAHPATR
ncbi:MAG: PP2C family serine/threonine-protein phosphatase, partial [Caldilineaceae bacterium]